VAGGWPFRLHIDSCKAGKKHWQHPSQTA